MSTRIESGLDDYSIIENTKANDLILYDYMVKCMKELAKAEHDIKALLLWNFKH